MRFINLELFKIASQDIFDGILGKELTEDQKSSPETKGKINHGRSRSYREGKHKKGEPHRRHSTGPVPGSVSSA